MNRAPKHSAKPAKAQRIIIVFASGLKHNRSDMHRRSKPQVESNARRYLEGLARRFAEFPGVRAGVLAGSRSVGTDDPQSDFDLYVYTSAEIPVEFRRALLGERAEIDNRFWEPGDEAHDLTRGLKLDIMYRSPQWIEEQLDRVLVGTK